MDGTQDFPPEDRAPVSVPGDNGWGPLSGLPGNPMMWILIASELLVFGGALIGFAGARVLDPQLFADSQSMLDRPIGALNTAVLLTSGLFAALAVQARREEKGTLSRLHLGIAALFGVVFMVVKFVEYGEKFAAGIDVDTNTFFTLYFLVTGFHLAHVVFGIIILGLVAIWNSEENLETGTAFWHMVDLVWVLIFPVIYLMR
ncbi:MAG: cytochrome c oxidase subunit 3 family protein [Hyphomicrobiales bacterium]